eukprot:600487-Rhodomonas_salina.1
MPVSGCAMMGHAAQRVLKERKLASWKPEMETKSCVRRRSAAVRGQSAAVYERDAAVYGRGAAVYGRNAPVHRRCSLSLSVSLARHAVKPR